MRRLMSKARGTGFGTWLRRITIVAFVGIFAAASPNLLTPEPQARAVPGGEPVDYSTNRTSGTDYAWAGDVPEFRVSVDATWESWLYPTASGYNAWVDKADTYVFAVVNGYHYWALWGNYGSSWTWINTGVPARYNEWQHVAWTKDSRVLTLYVDGQEVYNVTNAPGTLPNRGNFNVQSRGTYDFFRGRIDELRIWSKAKTQAEIIADMHNRPVNTAGLQAYFDFNDIGAGWVQNMAPNANSNSHLRIYGDLNPTDVKDIYPASATNNLTTYVFPRSYITREGAEEPKDEDDNVFIATPGTPLIEESPVAAWFLIALLLIAAMVGAWPATARLRGRDSRRA